MATINVFIPPGSTSAYSASITDHQNVGTRLQNPNTINKRVAEARLQDKMRKQLMEEFSKIDGNRDGQITKEELHEFFMHEKVSND